MIRLMLLVLIGVALSVSGWMLEARDLESSGSSTGRRRPLGELVGAPGPRRRARPRRLVRHGYDDLANVAVAMVVVQLAAGMRSKLDRLSW